MTIPAPHNRGYRQVNGYTIVGTMPMLDSEGLIVEYVIMGVRGEHTVTARMASLSDESWVWGNYYHGPTAVREALADMQRRWADSTSN